MIGELEQLSQVVVDHSIRKTNPDLWEWFQAHQIPVLEGKAERKSKTKGDERKDYDRFEGTETKCADDSEKGL